MAQAVQLPDYYAILEVASFSPLEAIASSYKRLALRFHPDKCREPGATERFQRIGEAWQVLRDSASRANYDRDFRSQRGLDREGWERARRRREEVDRQARANWHAGEYPSNIHDEERRRKARLWKVRARAGYSDRLQAWTDVRKASIVNISEKRRQLNRQEMKIDAQSMFSDEDMTRQFEQAIERSKLIGHRIDNPRATLNQLHIAWKEYKAKLHRNLQQLKIELEQLVKALDAERSKYEDGEARSRLCCTQEALEILGPRNFNPPLLSMIDRRGLAINHWNSLLRVRTGVKCFSSIEGQSEGPWHHAGQWQRIIGEHICAKCDQNAFHILEECGPAQCPVCAMILCNDCYRDLQLLREYHEWMVAPEGDCPNSLFSLDFVSGGDPRCIWATSSYRY